LSTGTGGDEAAMSPAMSISTTQMEKCALSSHTHKDDSSID